MRREVRRQDGHLEDVDEDAHGVPLGLFRGHIPTDDARCRGWRGGGGALRQQAGRRRPRLHRQPRRAMWPSSSSARAGRRQLRRGGRDELHYHKGSAEVASIVAASKSVDVRDKTGPPLGAACGQAAAARAEAGASVDLADGQRNTPLHLACADGYEEVALLLLQAGASADALNREKQAPLDLVPDAALRSRLASLRVQGGGEKRRE